MKRVLGLAVAAVLMMAVSGCDQAAKDNTIVEPTPTKEATPAKPTKEAAPAKPAVPVAAVEIIIDNKDAAFTTEGKWNTAAGDYFKDDVAWATKGETATAKATWTPTIVAPGTYAVYEWHGENPSSDHATDAPFTITFDGGSKDATVDLTSNMGKWNLLGTFKFAAGTKGNVSVTNKANGNVIADAVKFVPTK